MLPTTEEKVVRYLLKIVDIFENTHYDLKTAQEGEELLGEMGVYYKEQRKAAWKKAKKTGSLEDLNKVWDMRD